MASGCSRILEYVGQKWCVQMKLNFMKYMNQLIPVQAFGCGWLKASLVLSFTRGRIEHYWNRWTRPCFLLRYLSNRPRHCLHITIALARNHNFQFELDRQVARLDFWRHCKRQFLWNFACPPREFTKQCLNVTPTPTVFFVKSFSCFETILQWTQRMEHRRWMKTKSHVTKDIACAELSNQFHNLFSVLLFHHSVLRFQTLKDQNGVVPVFLKKRSWT